MEENVQATENKVGGKTVLFTGAGNEDGSIAAQLIASAMSMEERLNMIEGIETLYPVLEIFSSIQGEGSMMGMPVTFIRMAGCNLVCPWCDTKDSWKKVDPTTDIPFIMSRCDKSIVVITGGEPCMQDLVPLIDALQLIGKFVCIETNGTLATPPNVDWVVCSPKPSDYMIHAECFFNELKYVVDDNFDIDCIPEESKKTCGTTWLQPCDYGKKNKKKSYESMQKCVDLTLKYSYLRTGIQLHKILAIK